MRTEHSFANKFGGWLTPLVYLSSNWISLLGVVAVTTSAIFWLLLLPISFGGAEVRNPYFGILGFLLLPGFFLCGLLLIPVGIWVRFRKEHARGTYPAVLPPLDLKNVHLRRLLVFIAVATFVNIIIASQTVYQAVTYMDSVTFCGETCHTVMQPEFTAYQNSPHSRVECVKCHIGPGASWFVKSKLSGIWQVFAVTFHTYQRPIPTPVENLRPARETCETCHWPERYGGDRLRIIDRFSDNETNLHTKTVLLMHIGGAGRGPGIHGTHLGPGVVIRYTPRDRARQEIPWVEYNDNKGHSTVFATADFKTARAGDLPVRVMDCMDCHNRPTHTLELPERAVDRAMALGEISSSLPFVKKVGVDLLRCSYHSHAEAEATIPPTLERYYKEHYPDVYAKSRTEILRSARVLVAIFERNVFPEMKVSWGTYPNNIGHTDFTGCFRCHDDAHVSKDGRKITQDCSACHELLAVEEPSPKILTELGIRDSTPSTER